MRAELNDSPCCSRKPSGRSTATTWLNTKLHCARLGRGFASGRIAQDWRRLAPAATAPLWLLTLSRLGRVTLLFPPKIAPREFPTVTPPSPPAFRRMLQNNIRSLKSDQRVTMSGNIDSFETPLKFAGIGADYIFWSLAMHSSSKTQEFLTTSHFGRRYPNKTIEAGVAAEGNFERLSNFKSFLQYSLSS